jgi:hypothetical protein
LERPGRVEIYVKQDIERNYLSPSLFVLYKVFTEVCLNPEVFSLEKKKKENMKLLPPLDPPNPILFSN